jgi:hypothetical protein
MADTKYVVKIHDAKIDMIRKFTRCAAELTFVIGLNDPNTTRIWPAQMAITSMKLYNKYFTQRTGFSYPPFPRNEPYGDIPHSCEAKCITFRVLRISDIKRK